MRRKNTNWSKKISALGSDKTKKRFLSALEAQRFYPLSGKNSYLPHTTTNTTSFSFRFNKFHKKIEPENGWEGEDINLTHYEQNLIISKRVLNLERGK